MREYLQEGDQHTSKERLPSDIATVVPLEAVESAPSELDLINQRIDNVVKSVLASKRERVLGESLPTYSNYPYVALSDEIASTIEAAGFDTTNISIASPTKRNAATLGVDLALNVASAAKEASRNPVETAKYLKEQIKGMSDVNDANTAGPFVNIEIDYSSFAPKVLDQVKEWGHHYGHSRGDSPEVVLVDYSSPNVAKNMTVAHLRSTIIGHSIMKLQEATGNVSFGVNHIGDWGTQFGNIIYEYRRECEARGDEFLEELNANPTATLMRIYKQFNERKKEDPEAVRSAQDIFLQLEQGDPELLSLWKQFREWSLRDFDPTYKRLGVEFDAIQGESFYEGRMPAAVDEALEAGVLTTNNEGSVVFPSQDLKHPVSGAVNSQIMLNHDGEPRDEIIVKPSGGTVYLTRDLAAVRYRAKELGADRVLYVIGKEQQGHCMELFAMADQLGHFALGNAVHVSFGHLNINGRKMASRAGKSVLLNDVLDDAQLAAESAILERRGSIDGGVLTAEEVERARKIGTSAVVFNDLSHDRNNDIEFNPDIAKSLASGGSVYIQYTHTRLSKILKKAREYVDTNDDLTVPTDMSENEKRLVFEASRFPQVVVDAARTNSPHKIASYLTAYCKTVSAFYKQSPIINIEDIELRNFRLRLVEMSQQVIANAAHLLHVELPERM